MINNIWLIIFFGALLSTVIWYYKYLSQEKTVFEPEGKNVIHLSNGITQYELSGPDCSPTIVLIHGGTIPMCAWDNQVKEFTEAGFRVLRYDQFGRGGSQRLLIPYTRQIFNDQLFDLLNYLKIDQPVHLLGPSFGGAISVSFAASHPQRVQSIVLISPVLNLLDSDSPLVKPIRISSIPIIGDFVFRTIIKNEIIKRGQELILCPTCRSSFINQFKYKGTEQSFLSAFRNDAYGDYRKETKIAGEQIKNILLVRGKKDQEVTVKMIQQVRNDLPHCRFLELENAGHSPFAEKNTSEFMKILISFFNDR